MFQDTAAILLLFLQLIFLNRGIRCSARPCYLHVEFEPHPLVRPLCFDCGRLAMVDYLRKRLSLNSDKVETPVLVLKQPPFYGCACAHTHAHGTRWEM